jgi:hypothetical protein
MSPRSRRLYGLIAAIPGLLAPTLAAAALLDEVQVYTDDINAPDHFGLELHVNHTLQGRNQPDYAGEATPDHGTRVTPEFSYGLSQTLEAGVYLNSNIAPNGQADYAGQKLRLKWLPLQAAEHGGWFAGENIELSKLKRQYEEARLTIELRTIAGWRNAQWLLAFNPILDMNLREPDKGQPTFNIGLKAARKVADGISLGPEYYSDYGATRHLASWGLQNNVLYLVADFEHSAVPFSLGIGHSVSPAADRWTVKAIISAF